MAKKIKITQNKTNRSVGITLGIAIGLIVIWLTSKGSHTPIWLIYVSGGLILLAIVRPSTLTPVAKVWLGLGKITHKVFSPIILSFVYLIAVVPTGVYLKVTRQDPLRLKLEPKAKTYWIDREEPNIESESLKNQF